MRYKKQIILFVIISILFSFSLLVVEASSEIWIQTYGGKGHENPTGLVETSNGGFVLAGHTTSFGPGDFDFWLVKTDENGIMEWDKTYGGTENEKARSLIATSDGGYAIFGYKEYSGVYQDDISDPWLVKTDENGNEEWNQTYDLGAKEKSTSFVEASDGGFVLAGYMYYGGYGERPDSWIVKTDESGNVEWKHTYRGGFFRDIVATSDEGYALAGSRDNDFWLAKVDANGKIQWSKTYGGAETYSGWSLVQLSDGGYAVAGSRKSDFWLAKTDESGKMQWSQIYADEKSQTAYSLVETFDGGFVLAGETGFISHPRDPSPTWNFLVVKTDSYGNGEWKLIYSLGDGPVIQTSDGRYALAGYSREGYTSYSNAGYYDFWLAKIDAPVSVNPPAEKRVNPPAEKINLFLSTSLLEIMGLLSIAGLILIVLFFIKTRKKKPK